MSAAPEYRYFDAVKDAWAGLWKNPGLWFLGALASLGSGGGGTSSESFSAGGSPDTSWVEEVDPGTAMPGSSEVLSALQSAADWILANLWVIAAVITGIFVIWIVSWLISVWFGAALIRGTATAVAGSKARFFESVRAVKGTVKRYMGLVILFDLFRLLTVAIIVVPIIVLALGALSAVQWGNADLTTEMVDAVRVVAVALLAGPVILFVIAALFIALPLHFVVGIIQELSARHLILDGAHVRPALSYGFSGLAATPGRTLLVGVIGYATGAVGALVMGIAALIILAIPAILAVLAIIGLVDSGSVGGAVAVGVLALALFLPLLLFLGGIVQAYMALYWTHSYRSLQPFLVSSQT